MSKANEPQNSPTPGEKADKITVLSKRTVPGVGEVRVVTDGKRVWKEAPEDSGMGPQK